MTKAIVGTVSKVKTGKPYPLTRPNGDVWQCKVRIKYLEQDDDDGEWEEEVYKAYPTPDLKDACSLPKGTKILAEVEYKEKSPYRGKLLSYTVME